MSQPIPLELLTPLEFHQPPIQRASNLLGFRGLGRDRGRQESDTASLATGDKPEAVDSRSVYPCNIYNSGRVGGHHILFAESAAARTEWKTKLDEALFLRKAVQEANKVRRCHKLM